MHVDRGSSTSFGTRRCASCVRNVRPNGAHVFCSRPINCDQRRKRRRLLSVGKFQTASHKSQLSLAEHEVVEPARVGACVREQDHGRSGVRGTVTLFGPTNDAASITILREDVLTHCEKNLHLVFARVAKESSLNPNSRSSASKNFCGVGCSSERLE